VRFTAGIPPLGYYFPYAFTFTEPCGLLMDNCTVEGLGNSTRVMDYTFLSYYSPEILRFDVILGNSVFSNIKCLFCRDLKGGAFSLYTNRKIYIYNSQPVLILCMHLHLSPIIRRLRCRFIII
jgi:hypothetical protein